MQQIPETAPQTHFVTIGHGIKLLDNYTSINVPSATTAYTKDTKFHSRRWQGNVFTLLIFSVISDKQK